MKKTLNILGLCALLAILGFMFASTPARCESIITFKPESVTVLKDKNGAEYVRMLISESKTMNGVSYKQTRTVNAYRELVSQAKQFKPGDTVTAVVQERKFNGQDYFTALGFQTSTAKK